MNRQGLISQEVSRAAQALMAQGASADEALLKSGADEPTVMGFLSEEFHVPLVDLEKRDPRGNSWRTSPPAS